MSEHLFDSPLADEWPLVFDTWARSFKKSPWAGCVPNHKYDDVSRAAIAAPTRPGNRYVQYSDP